MLPLGDTLWIYKYKFIKLNDAKSNHKRTGVAIISDVVDFKTKKLLI